MLFAQFQNHSSCRCRVDTRIYFHNCTPSSSDPCRGVVILKNPGGAATPAGSGTGLIPLNVSKSKILPIIQSLFSSAVTKAENLLRRLSTCE
jgi:hypothetical protein